MNPESGLLIFCSSSLTHTGFLMSLCYADPSPDHASNLGIVSPANDARGGKNLLPFTRLSYPVLHVVCM